MRIGRVIATTLLLYQCLRAASITISPMTAFGQPVSGCIVERFSRGDADGPMRDYGRSFGGLHSDGLPLGEYDLSLRCGKDLVRSRVVVERPAQFEIVVRNERFLVPDHIKPTISVKLDTPSVFQGAWIRAVGMYNHQTYTASFDDRTRLAILMELEPGSYDVIIGQPNGATCSREIDVVESTRSWTTDSNCSFQLDDFAHVVSDADRRSGKSEGWYEEVRKKRAALMRVLQDAAGK
jgi:hypothetical protein